MGSNIGEWCLLERVEQALERSVRSTTAVGVTAHAIDDDEERRLVARRDRDAILIVLSITDQAEICVLDPQSASAPAGTALQLLHCPKYGGAL